MRGEYKEKKQKLLKEKKTYFKNIFNVEFSISNTLIWTLPRTIDTVCKNNFSRCIEVKRR